MLAQSLLVSSNLLSCLVALTTGMSFAEFVVILLDAVAVFAIEAANVVEEFCLTTLAMLL